MVALPTQSAAPIRDVPRIDHERARAAVRELLIALGEDPDRDGLRDTPRRVARMYAELFAGMASDPADHLERTFAEQHDDLIVLREIELSSLCEHHLLPFMGRAHVAYLPRRGVVGLSKLARVVEGFARRPQIQERLTNQIADAIFERTGARGAMVLIEAEHLCMKVRGVNQRGTQMLTTAARGELRVEPSRERTLSLLRGR